MDAPDKIYIKPILNPSDDYVGIAWKDAHGKMDEYIRKDALLEWLNARVNDYGHTTPFRIAIQRTIDKLNEL